MVVDVMRYDRSGADNSVFADSYALENERIALPGNHPMHGFPSLTLTFKTALIKLINSHMENGQYLSDIK